MTPDLGSLDVRHRSSHRALLRAPLDSGLGRALDAVVVPASRPAVSLESAMALAAELDAVFVPLCSGRAKRREVARLARQVPGLRFAIVPVPADYSEKLVDFRTSYVRPARALRLGDLSLKRNLGLLLGHLSGWQSLLFLDDDMRMVDPHDVRLAVAALKPGGAVGLPAVAYPDNSVVCHARRAVGEWQDVFVSGSALVVDCQHVHSFFPRVYNEDWLFLADALRRGLVSAVGASSQLEYDPFESPLRAAAEEFGDVLAEGLVGLLHGGASFTAATAGQWEDGLVQRKQLIADLMAAAGEHLDPEAAKPVLAALEAAARRCSLITGFELASYVRTWRLDLDTWRTRLRGLRRGRPLPGALDRLGLGEWAVLSEDRRPGVVVTIPSRAVAPATSSELAVG